MKKIIVLVGLPGAGKSTLTNKILSDNTVIVSSDEIRKIKLKLPFSEEVKELVFNHMIEDTINYLSIDNTDNIIIDTTYLNEKEYRVRLLSSLEQYNSSNFEVIFINLQTDVEVCIQSDKTRSGDCIIGEEIIRLLNDKMTFMSYLEYSSTSNYKIKILNVLRDTFNISMI